MKEKVFQDKFRKHIEKLGGLTQKIPGNMYMRGWPDVYISICKNSYNRGLIVPQSFQGWIEFKGPDTAIHPLQKKIIKDLQRCGTNAFIIRAFESQTYAIYTNMDDFDKNVIIHDWNPENYLPSLIQASRLLGDRVK